MLLKENKFGSNMKFDMPKRIYYTEKGLVKKFVDVNYSNNLRNYKWQPEKKRLVLFKKEKKENPIVKNIPEFKQSVNFFTHTINDSKFNQKNVEENYFDSTDVQATPDANNQDLSKKSEMQRNLNYLLKSINKKEFSDNKIIVESYTERETHNSQHNKKRTEYFEMPQRTREYYNNKVEYLTKTIWGSNSIPNKTREVIKLPAIGKISGNLGKNKNVEFKNSS
jgi:hypothetical protein